jgi:hypothetical protein
MIGLVGMSERRLGHSQPRDQCHRLPPLFIVQRDGGPQPWIGWCPRLGREVKRERGLGPVSLDAH